MQALTMCLVPVAQRPAAGGPRMIHSTHFLGSNYAPGQIAGEAWCKRVTMPPAVATCSEIVVVDVFYLTEKRARPWEGRDISGRLLRPTANFFVKHCVSLSWP